MFCNESGERLHEPSQFSWAWHVIKGNGHEFERREEVKLVASRPRLVYDGPESMSDWDSEVLGL